MVKKKDDQFGFFKDPFEDFNKMREEAGKKKKLKKGKKGVEDVKISIEPAKKIAKALVNTLGRRLKPTEKDKADMAEEKFEALERKVKAKERELKFKKKLQKLEVEEKELEANNGKL